MKEAIVKITVRSFKDENGDLYEVVRSVQGYCPSIKVGDVYLFKTKQELEEDERRFNEVFAKARKMNEEYRAEQERKSQVKQVELSDEWNAPEDWDCRADLAVSLALEKGWIIPVMDQMSLFEEGVPV